MAGDPRYDDVALDALVAAVLAAAGLPEDDETGAVMVEPASERRGVRRSARISIRADVAAALIEKIEPTAT